MTLRYRSSLLYSPHLCVGTGSGGAGHSEVLPYPDNRRNAARIQPLVTRGFSMPPTCEAKTKQRLCRSWASYDTEWKKRANTGELSDSEAVSHNVSTTDFLEVAFHWTCWQPWDGASDGGRDDFRSDWTVTSSVGNSVERLYSLSIPLQIARRETFPLSPVSSHSTATTVVTFLPIRWGECPRLAGILYEMGGRRSGPATRAFSLKTWIDQGNGQRTVLAYNIVC
jgi:hypothetical protein